jgi:glycosyl transferase family 25
VLEDDIHLTGVSFSNMVDAIKLIDRPWFYIKILGMHQPSHLLRSQVIEEFTLSTFQKVPARTGAQIVSREGAIRLLKSTAPFYRPVDLDLQYWWEKNIFVDVLHPYVFAVNHNEVSDIDAQKSRKKSAKKPIKRIFDRIKYYGLVHKHGRALRAKLFV